MGKQEGRKESESPIKSPSSLLRSSASKLVFCAIYWGVDGEAEGADLSDLGVGAGRESRWREEEGADSAGEEGGTGTGREELKRDQFPRG